MTKEDLKQQLLECYDHTDSMIEIIEEYYRERTCGNCHCMIDSICESIETPYYKLKVDKDFGCNKFEEKV